MSEISAKSIIGYLSPLTALPGDTVNVYVSTETPVRYHASFIRLISGDNRSRGTGYADENVPATFEGHYAGRHQPLVAGSWALLGDLPVIESPAISCWFYPTLAERDQVLVSGPGLVVRLLDSYCHVTAGNRNVRIPLTIRSHHWHHLCLCMENGKVHAACFREGSVSESAGQGVVSGAMETTQVGSGRWYLATGDASAGGNFNGRLEALTIAGSNNLKSLQTGAVENVIARWHFGYEMTTQRLFDMSGQFEGRFHQHPTRAVKGHLWDGTSQCWNENLDHYGAVHFHEDDLTDASWSVDFSFQVPRNLNSGLYAVRLETEAGDEDIMPLFVSPGPDQKRKPVALLMSTATYLAYANQRLSISDGLFGRGVRNPSDKYLLENPEVGNSLYEQHLDGSGVHFSSRLRPVVNLKPKTLTWSFNADTNLTAWLEAINQPFDVITDEQLHEKGESLLEDYRVVITGSHPEYHSTEMLDGLESWMGNGGRLMYMGGNGFYWRIAYDPENPAVIEVRRAEDGTRAWMSESGEYYHQFTGEYGGLWSRLGRPPNRLVGIGFTAQGFDGGTCYRVSSESRDPRVSFIFEGVDQEIVGDHGTQAGGAAGEEIDRFDRSLGSPRHGIVLASSENHRPGMLVTKEEFLMTVPEPRGSKVRADMTFFETPAGGAVFSTGSISYAGSLATHDYQNDIARLTGNVLERFLDPTPFPFPED